ncbi:MULTISPECIES: hypothetical protein [Exiguobacterium]|uniref:hypothetical protein n=1 Tax=Exiguobacterium TaxID=33986 RepID=UPI0004951BAE|nr:MULTISPECIES: hypothetical protein [Exiguobacterium]KGI86619.1 hypothetical protein JY98_10385 [Exiguobacterium mexicanum]TCI69238.1 hypothetical protein EVJ19_09650 [Exiguobacterium sp. IPCI3]TCI78698.1 hypothetical protein EVJ18_09650 [Exiguobacterium sp. IPCH1]TCI81202.1 hypothetical protein EVJ17_09650 [Exiguobacterium sp. IPBC4]
MKNRLSRYYCQYSGIVIGFGLVFAFLFGIRTYSFWQQWLPNGFALLITFLTAMLFSYVTYRLLSALNLKLFHRLGDATSTCSR